MNPPDSSQEYGVKESDTVGTRIKEAPGLGAPQAELPDWEELKATLMTAVDHAVLRRLQNKGRFR
ncbi:MAG: hypothetical protein M3Z36_06450 [Acidobacteriota bacterium]|nr:hypothetical protein [Acidobacteriota bacterium]